jgi:hypothetical protein
MEKNELAYEWVWRGRLHIGEEPGIYGDAAYAGLCAEWPITFRRFEPGKSTAGRILIRVNAEDVTVFDNYPGHKVTLYRYEPDPSGDDPRKWKKILADNEIDSRLKSNEVELVLDVPEGAEVLHASVRVEADATVQPGSYNEFVVTRLEILSLTHYASLGFM